MRPTTVIAIVALFTSLIAIVVAALSRHKKAGTGNIKLIGEIARVDSRLDPEGTVIISGELWRARSNSGDSISPHARVRVVGFEHLLALVEVCD
jgi:membrane-bound serine protease (ClpP class)